ncbi:MAG: hypothetical protein RQ824_02460 [bacterium]|nr:hypothetical protein [bacterium]
MKRPNPKKKKKSTVQEVIKAAEPSSTPPPSPPPSPCVDKEARLKVSRVASQIALVLLIMFIMVWGRSCYFQQNHYSEAEAAFKDKNYKDAMTSYEWTIKMYTPLSGEVEDACEKLWFIAGEYEKKGELDFALIAYRSLRSSIYSIKSLYLPYGKWISLADEKIEGILAMQKLRETAASAAGKDKAADNN